VREIVPQIADQIEKIVRRILQTGESATGIEVSGQRADKSNAERVWLTSWHPLKADDGSIVGINVVAEETASASAPRRHLLPANSATARWCARRHRWCGRRRPTVKS
jgi:hypothetical protein